MGSDKWITLDNGIRIRASAVTVVDASGFDLLLSVCNHTFTIREKKNIDAAMAVLGGGEEPASPPNPTPSATQTPAPIREITLVEELRALAAQAREFGDEKVSLEQWQKKWNAAACSSASCAMAIDGILERFIIAPKPVPKPVDAIPVAADPERRLFDAWNKTRLTGFSRQMSGMGYSYSMAVEQMWTAWQARAAHDREREAKMRGVLEIVKEWNELEGMAHLRDIRKKHEVPSNVSMLEFIRAAAIAALAQP